MPNYTFFLRQQEVPNRRSLCIRNSCSNITSNINCSNILNHWSKCSASKTRLSHTGSTLKRPHSWNKLAILTNMLLNLKKQSPLPKAQQITLNMKMMQIKQTNVAVDSKPKKARMLPNTTIYIYFPALQKIVGSDTSIKCQLMRLLKSQRFKVNSITSSQTKTG